MNIGHKSIAGCAAQRWKWEAPPWDEHYRNLPKWSTLGDRANSPTQHLVPRSCMVLVSSTRTDHIHIYVCGERPIARKLSEPVEIIIINRPPILIIINHPDLRIMRTYNNWEPGGGALLRNTKFYLRRSIISAESRKTTTTTTTVHQHVKKKTSEAYPSFGLRRGVNHSWGSKWWVRSLCSLPPKW